MPVVKRRSAEKKGKGLLFIGIVVILLALVMFFVKKEDFFLRKEVKELGEDQPEQLSEAIRGGRKNIYDRNFMELAVSFRRSSIYARPLELDNPEEVARQVAQILALDAKDVAFALKGERSFAWLGKDIDQKKAEKIADLNLKGVYRIDQVHRYYPGNQLGAHVVGFIKDAQGLGGVEFYYDSILRGGGVHDARLATAGVSKKVVEGGDGASLVLTLDIHLQNILEQKLSLLAGKIEAKAAMALVMAPDTGEIIALASMPAFDPNRYWEYSTAERKNRVVENMVELGGIERLFQMAHSLRKKGGAVPAPAPESVSAVHEGASPASASAEGDHPAAEQTAPPVVVAWNMVREGVYVSPEGISLDRFAASGEDYTKFAENIGLASKAEADLPEALFAMKEGGLERKKTVVEPGSEAPKPSEKTLEVIAGSPPASLDLQPQLQPEKAEREMGATATPMALLSAFCRVVNGGKVMKPHVLNAVWHDSQVWDVPPREGVGEFVVPAEVSHGVLEWLKGATSPGSETFVIESLVQKKMVQQSLSAGTNAEGADPAANNPPPVANLLLLGTAPVKHPEIAMLVVLEGAVIDVQVKSAARGLAEEIIPIARATITKKPSMPSARELKIREVGYYRKWEKLQDQVEVEPVLPEGARKQVMPDVTGYSLRKAMQILQPYGLRVQIVGTGQVVSQHPLPEGTLKGIDQCVLELKKAE